MVMTESNHATSPNAPLFQPLAVGDLTLAHRVVLAPLTRQRSTQPGDIPNALNATYYAQRATPGGLLISEATQISREGKGYPATPGIYSPEQVAGWRMVTDAVHAKGGFLFAQLWHVGRISHSSLHPEVGLPVSASAIAPTEGKTFTAAFEMVEFETPRALAIEELPRIVADYVHAARCAQEAGFDGVELHSANGYLLDQFLEDGVNHRRDAYGGSIENRARLLLEVVDAVIAVWGAGRVGVRLSPWGKFNSMRDSNPVRLFTYVLEQLSARGIAYAHLVEPRANGGAEGDLDAAAPDAAGSFRKAFPGTLIAAGGFVGATASRTVASGDADAIAFGRWFISNPDLPRRLRMGAQLNRYDRSTFYGGGEQGYTDYPTLEEAAEAEEAKALCAEVLASRK
jgi:N-ethylmaleimide reductase